MGLFLIFPVFSTFFSFSSFPLAAQALDGLTGDSNAPMEIQAEEGIEWIEEKKVYIARGKAQATRGELIVNADVLTAHYRPTEEGGTDIWRLDADGTVKIRNPSSVTYADRGVFDITKGILVLTGRHLRMETGNNTVTARDSLEYWQLKNMAVARGSAHVVSKDRQMDADILIAYFHEVPEKGMELQRIEAFDNVKIKTSTETATSERGIYDMITGIVSIFGSVKIFRGNDQLTGEYGEVNLETGISRLLNAPPSGGRKGRVRAVFSAKKGAKIESKESQPPR
jgi:lipopolysaccharide export system protein LptA